MFVLKQIGSLCLYLLALFVSGIAFLFVVTLLIVASYLAIMIGRELYELYVKDLVRRLKQKLSMDEPNDFDCIPAGWIRNWWKNSPYRDSDAIRNMLNDWKKEKGENL